MSLGIKLYLFLGDAAGGGHPVGGVKPPSALLHGLGVQADGGLKGSLGHRGVDVPRLDQRRVPRLRNREGPPQGAPGWRWRWVRYACILKASLIQTWGSMFRRQGSVGDITNLVFQKCVIYTWYLSIHGGLQVLSLSSVFNKSLLCKLVKFSR